MHVSVRSPNETGFGREKWIALTHSLLIARKPLTRIRPPHRRHVRLDARRGLPCRSPAPPRHTTRLPYTVMEGTARLTAKKM